MAQSELSFFSEPQQLGTRVVKKAFVKKKKEEALKEGYSWNDFENPTHSTTVKSEELPDTIKTTEDLILEKVIECSNCKRAYRIVQGELALLRKMNLPIPHECPKCRENKRFERLTKIKMYHRTCMKCGVNIYTPYAPEDHKIVYCVKCYQQEFA